MPLRSGTPSNCSPNLCAAASSHTRSRQSSLIAFNKPAAVRRLTSAAANLLLGSADDMPTNHLPFGLFHTIGLIGSHSQSSKTAMHAPMGPFTLFHLFAGSVRRALRSPHAGASRVVSKPSLAHICSHRSTTSTDVFACGSPRSPRASAALVVAHVCFPPKPDALAARVLRRPAAVGAIP